MIGTFFAFFINFSLIVFIICVSVKATNPESSTRRNPASLFLWYFFAFYTAYNFPVQLRSETPSYILVMLIGLSLGSTLSFFALSNQEKEKSRLGEDQKQDKIS